ncbi:Pyrrolidone-carboxylate peptidase [Usitatibacter rugosus]|uniref:Pyrrolidone-carboxylate peptidase n=1 Tax=Usitatibacter rugosus TaxID=2732067 RepID=A0A6M4GSC2_9PROT|nr:pyroglutamyl-peptidase I [Usitatibacter rugosus]QJR10002.1 Pyrrolidone-carboxylate peptidase [Usitatibacter rugosus]
MTMLRRRTRRPKPDTRKPAPPAVTETRSRRRARPGAVVPAELIVTEETTPQAKASRANVVLVTGFEPFGGEASNPSWEICKRLPATIGKTRVETLQVPCLFRTSIETVAEAIEKLKPALVVCIGQAGGRDRISIERVGINIDDARAPDNGGERPVDEAIAPNGPPAYFTTLPIKAMAKAVRDAGIPAEVSNTAGTYVCNHLLYGVLHFIAASGHATRAGFIHVPYADAQVLDKPGQPSMSVDAMARGIEAAITAALAHKTDTKISEGRET